MISHTINITDKQWFSSVFWIPLKFIFVFLYIYEFNFTAFDIPTIVTGRRIVVAFLLIFGSFLAVIKRNKLFRIESNNYFAKKGLRKIIYLHILLLVYTLFLVLFIGKGNGQHIFDFEIKFISLGILPIFVFYRIFKSLDEFMYILLCTSILQTIVIIYCLINPFMGDVLDAIFVQEGVIDHRSGYAGGIACITAPGLFRFSMGQIACLYFVLSRNKTLLYWILYAVLGFTATMIARTGLLVSLLGLILILLKYRNNISKIVLNSLFIIIIVVFGYYILCSYDFFSYFNFERLQDLFYGDGIIGFFNGYYTGEATMIPPLSIETIIGTGIVSGVSSNGIPVNVDGGYLRLYVGLGLACCLIFYYVMLSQINKIRKSFVDNTIKITLTFFFIVILIAEYKEFTFYEQYMVCIFFVMALLASKDKSVIKNC